MVMKKVFSVILCLALVMSIALSAFALASVSVKGIQLDKSALSLEVGKSYTLKVTLTPANTTQKLLKYNTSDKNVATIDNNGVIVAVKAGKAVITVVSSSNSKILAKCDVTAFVKPKVKLSFCLSQTGWGGEAVDPELMTAVEKVIEGKTNTDLEVIAPPQSTYNDKLNVILASGQIPDIYAIRKAMDTVQVMAARGYTMPLDEVVKGFPEITSATDKALLENLKVNGKLMAVPMYVPLSKVIWLRKDMVEKYGVNLSETPTTEQFYTEMKKMAGKGFVPFSFAKFLDNLPFFFNPFGAYYGIGVKDGKYFDGFNCPEAKEALAYAAKLYKDKIWDQEFLTLENAGMREKLASGKAASALDYFNRYIYYASESAKINAATDFQPVYELKGPKGIGGNLNEAIQDALAIGPNCKYPDRALEVIKYYVYTDEGVMLRNLGVKGLHYTIENGVITPTAKATNSGYKCDVNGFFLYFPKITDFGFKWDATTEKLLPNQVKVNIEVTKHQGPKYLVPGGISDIYDKNLPAYKKKIDEISAKLITGADSVFNGYEEYQRFWNSINGNEMLKQLNTPK
jgi:putative aldouronate transport system substrate-binding protein